MSCNSIIRHYSIRLKRYHYLLMFLCLSAFHSALFADNSDSLKITFKAYSETSTVQSGRKFQVRFDLLFENVQSSENGKDFKAPDFKGFNILYGPSVSQSSMTNIINGEMSFSRTVSYTYVLEAVKSGTHTIAPASIKVGNETFQSESLKINVTSGREPDKEKEQKKSTPTKITLNAFAPDSVESGQRFKVTFEVNAQERDLKLKDPVFDDFLVLTGPNVSVSNTIDYVNGQRVLVPKTFYVYLLEAEKEGTFTIPATEITVNGKKYKSKPIKIKVVKKTEYKTPQQRKREEKSNSVFV